MAAPALVDFSRMYENPELEATFRAAVPPQRVTWASTAESKRIFSESNIFDIFSDHARPIEMVVGTEYYHAEARKKIMLDAIRDRYSGRRFYYVPDFQNTFTFVGRYVGSRRFGYGDGGRIFYDFRKDDGTVTSVELSYEGLSLFITKDEYEARLRSKLIHSAWARRRHAVMIRSIAHGSLGRNRANEVRASLLRAAPAPGEPAAAAGGAGAGAAPANANHRKSRRNARKSRKQRHTRRY